MHVADSDSKERYSAIAASLFERLLDDYHPRNFAVRFWDGTCLAPDVGQDARFTLVIQSPAALREMLRSPSELSLGEAYIYDDIDIEGDVEAAFSLGLYLMQQKPAFSERLQLGAILRKLPPNGSDRRDGNRAASLSGRLHSMLRDRAAIHYHYDTSNDFFSLFLGKTMIYSEAYFENGEKDLDQAQQRQLDRICRALHLKAGERLLDIGCGWGSLILHAVKNYGVKALGITLSERQAEFANECIQKEGMSESCAVQVRDYRELDAAESFDKISSVGMFEHVGRKMLGEYFQRVRGMLRAGGAFLNSGISRPVEEPAKRPSSFIDKYVFPDGELVPIGEIAQEAEQAEFEVRSIESLREQYGLTLREWLSRLEKQRVEACRVAGDVVYRIWRLYMAASAARFFEGKLNTYQMLLVKR